MVGPVIKMGLELDASKSKSQAKAAGASISRELQKAISAGLGGGASAKNIMNMVGAASRTPRTAAAFQRSASVLRSAYGVEQAQLRVQAAREKINSSTMARAARAAAAPAAKPGTVAQYGRHMKKWATKGNGLGGLGGL